MTPECRSRPRRSAPTIRRVFSSTYHILQITKGAAFTLDDNGFETLRRLRGQFGKTKRQTMTFRLMRSVLQKFDEAKFGEQLTKWEFVIFGYERVTNERLPQLLDDLTTYHETKIMVVSCCRRSYLAL